MLPLHAPQPRLVGRCYSRTVLIEAGRQSAFMDEISKWVASCVTSRTKNPATGSAYHRESDLVHGAFSELQEIYQYGLRRPGMHTIEAKPDWGMLANGLWYVKAMHFSTVGLILPPPPPDPPEPNPHFCLRCGIFDVHVNENTYSGDVDAGQKLVEHLKANVHGEAKKDAHLIENPIETPDAQGLFDTAKDIIKEGTMPWKELFKMTVGSTLQAFLNSQAGDVKKKRMLAYSWFIEGLVREITYTDGATPSSTFEKKYFELGRQAAQSYSAKQRYQIQLYLLYYASQNPTSGWRVPQPQVWHFPEDFERNWDPRVMGEALYNQLSRQQFSVD